MSNESFSYFIGPKAENINYLKELINKILDFQDEWRKSFYKNDDSVYPELNIHNANLEKELELFLQRSKSNLPFFHPRYAAQMVKDPSFPTILGYLTFLLSNPNNHAYEGGPVTTEMEMEVIDLFIKFTGLNSGWGHLTSGGSLANTEALWAARDFYPDGTVYFSEVSHYSWKRICNILRINNYKEIPVDKNFRMDLNILEDKLKKNPAMFVMANLGSTGSGSVDDILSILELRKKYKFHLHVDAAYGGFTKSVILNDSYSPMQYSGEMNLSEYVYNQLSVLGEADSITIDPHKHGLISYGAGAVLFKNEELRNVVINTAPYTYHKLDKPNIGMFSLEGSRPGAMAAACYLTYKVLPPNCSGLGKIIANSLASSKKFYELIQESTKFENINYPDLDINCIYRKAEQKTIEEINNKTSDVYNKFSIEAAEPEFILSKFVTSPEIARTLLPEYSNEGNKNLTALRLVFMKHWSSLDDFRYVRELVNSLEM